MQLLLRNTLLVGLASVLFWLIVVGFVTSPLWISLILINVPTAFGLFMLVKYTNVSGTVKKLYSKLNIPYNLTSWYQNSMLYIALQRYLQTILEVIFWHDILLLSWRRTNFRGFRLRKVDSWWHYSRRLSWESWIV